MEFYSLEDLSNVEDDNCSIKVKVARKWEEINGVDRNVEGLNIIFIDPYVSYKYSISTSYLWNHKFIYISFSYHFFLTYAAPSYSLLDR